MEFYNLGFIVSLVAVMISILSYVTGILSDVALIPANFVYYKSYTGMALIDRYVLSQLLGTSVLRTVLAVIAQLVVCVLPMVLATLLVWVGVKDTNAIIALVSAKADKSS